MIVIINQCFGKKTAGINNDWMLIEVGVDFAL